MNKLTNTITRRETLLGLVYIAVQLFVLPFIGMLLNQLLDSPLSAVQMQFLLFCVDFICVTLIFHRFLLTSLKHALSNLWQTLRIAGIGLLLYWLGGFVVNFVIVAIYPDFSNVNDASISQLVKQNYSLMAISTVLLVPITEETLYRGLIFGSLYKRSPIVGYVLSTLLFAALHVVGYIGLYEPLHLLMCFLQYIPAGLSLAWAYVKADTIWSPILIHIIINQIGVMAMR